MLKIILKLGTKIIEVLMNKQLTQERNLEELMRLTLINILNAKGLYYRKYQQQYQQRHQSYHFDYLPMKS